jgi:citrate lyase subunit beta/citryl-CoA lyase
LRPPRRTLLFVPVLVERFLAKAHERGADGVILDLEDSIAPEAKEAARRALPAAIGTLAARGIELWVRVNAPKDLMSLDLATAAAPGVHGIMLPKVDQPTQVAAADELLARLEREKGFPAGAIRLSATLETPGGVLAAPAIAAGPRLEALAFGAEDLAAAIGVAPTPGFARGPAQMVALAAAAHGLEAWGLAGSIAQFAQGPAFARAVSLSRALGLTTILCIHPGQVDIAQRLYRPSEAEIARAAAIVAEYEAALGRGEGSIQLDGRMIDQPVYVQARRLLAAAAGRRERG